MRLSEIFEHLTSGELSQLALGVGDNGEIAPESYPKLISSVNLGLLELYKRFPVLEKQVIIQQYDAITQYQLLYKYAESNTESSEDPKYIVDTVLDPFLEDVLKIEQVYNELGEEIPLNNSEDDDSYFTPYVSTLQVPQPDSENATTILYRAAPEKILVAGLDPFEEEVAVPYQLLEALLFYVAARAHSSIAAGSPADVTYLTKFENACAQVERFGLSQVENNSNVKPEREGWV